MRLIDAEEAKKAMECVAPVSVYRIDNVPTVDAAPVVHGLWENVKETEMYVPEMKFTTTHTAETCSVCRARVGFIGPKMYLYDKFCPECGAKMDLKGSDKQ